MLNQIQVLRYVNRFIWNNRFLMVDNKTVFYKILYNAGIIYVNDLLDQEGKFDVYGTLGDGFNNMDYLKLIGIIHSIPNSWKRQITSKIVMEEATALLMMIVFQLRKLPPRLFISVLFRKLKSLQFAGILWRISIMWMRVVVNSCSFYHGK